jgi:Na+-driven multidrug efflux pump
MAKNNLGTGERYRWWQPFCGTATPADVRNNRRMLLSTLVWVVAFLASTMVMERFGDDSLAVSSVAMAVAAVAWIPVVRGYLRFMRETDELTRLVQTQAMAIAFAAGLLVSLLGRFIERIASFLPDPLPGLVEVTDIFNPAMVMCATYAIAALTIHRSYSR